MKQKKYQPGKEPGYKKKVYLKLAKRVHADLKKKGLNPKWNESQKFTSEYLYPKFKNELLSKINFTKIDKALNIQLDKNREEIEEEFDLVIPIPELDEDCGSIFKVPIEDILSVEWWAINEQLRIIPYNVKVRVNGGGFGSTEIAKAAEIDYTYELSPIVEEIRKFTNNGSGPSWTGVQKIVPGKKDDGKNCSYFIDFILDAEGVVIEDFDKQAFEPLTEAEKETRLQTIKQAEIDKKERGKQRDEARLIKDKLDASKKRKRPKEQPKEEDTKTIFDLTKGLQQLFEEYKLGIYDAAEYKKEKAKLIKLAERLNK